MYELSDRSPKPQTVTIAVIIAYPSYDKQGIRGKFLPVII